MADKYTITMVAPNGKAEVEATPDNLERFKNLGWKELEKEEPIEEQEEPLRKDIE